MGHTRLGRLPRTRPWEQVTALLSSASGAPALVGEAILAAAKQLFGDPATGSTGPLTNDPGLVSSFYVLLHVAFRARERDFLAELRAHGVPVPEEDAASALAFVGRVSQTARSYVDESGRGTAFSEIAILALRETLSRTLSQRASTLFGTDAAAVQAACKYYATTQRFGGLARDFFGTFLYRSLAFFASKAIHDHVGPGRRFSQLCDLDGFEEALREWSYERAKIVESFSGGWASKEDYQTGIDLAAAQRFVAVAVGKLGSELAIPDCRSWDL